MSNRPRLQLTGLEEPEELWDRLKEATAEAQSLNVANKKLHARVRVLERQLSEVGSLTDDELVAELPKRMSRALESAQGVSNEIVQRARKNEAAIQQKATEAAADIVRQAEQKAASILSQTATEAASYIAKTEERARNIVAIAQRRRKEILAEMEDEASTLQQRVAVLRTDQSRLMHAHDIVERTLAEARRALGDATAAPRPHGAHPSARPGAGDILPGRSDGLKPGTRRPRVFDWSPPAANAG